ncbi:hypothetical protein BJX99DRAFT_263803 [Aspergillus californicus]
MGADAAGWLHQGMANRLALDIGFNIEPALLPGAAQLPQEEFDLRRHIYWTLYYHDKLAASYTNNHSITKLPESAETALPRPDSSDWITSGSEKTSQLLIAMTLRSSSRSGLQTPTSWLAAI